MESVARLLADIDLIGQTAPEDLGRIMRGVADLFALGCDQLDADQIKAFDIVLEDLARRADTRARCELSNLLAPLGTAPKTTLCRLACDEIVVARPVLTASIRLDDQDLMAVALRRGRDHMLAICERTHVSEAVTDLLVARGEAVVQHAIAANPNARFSLLSAATLLARSRSDEGLLELLGQRRDLSPAHMRELVEIVREAARRRLSRSLSYKEDPEPKAIVPGRDAAAEFAPSSAVLDAVGRLADMGLLDETSLAAFARDGHWPEAAATLAYLSGLPVERIELVLEEGDDDLLIVIGRARDWSFSTIRAVLAARARPPDIHAVWRAERSYTTLAPSTAARMLQFIKLRDSAALRVPSRSSRVTGVGR